MDTEITTIDSEQLDTVTGGIAWGPILSGAASWLGGLFGGGSNTNVQAGSGNRTAQGNTGNVSLGDGSPVTAPAQR